MAFFRVDTIAGAGQHAAFGLAGIGGVVLEFKHGLPEIIEPFEGCSSIWQAVGMLHAMSDKAVLGEMFWIAILGGSLYASAKSLLSFVRKLRPPSIKPEAALPEQTAPHN